MNILLKYPTRGRPVIFLKTLQRYLSYASGLIDLDILVAMDTDDETMNNNLMRDCICQWDDAYKGNIEYYYADHDGIIEAVNSRIAGRSFDVVMAIADDFVPIERGYDTKIATGMHTTWPNYDGAIYFNDGDCGERFALAPILGRELYRQQGYFFDPFYKWGEADRALTVELRNKGKLTYFPEVLFSHNGRYHDNDEIYRRTRAKRLADHRKYKQRVKEGYYADQT